MQPSVVGRRLFNQAHEWGLMHFGDLELAGTGYLCKSNAPKRYPHFSSLELPALAISILACLALQPRAILLPE